MYWSARPTMALPSPSSASATASDRSGHMNSPYSGSASPVDSSPGPRSRGSAGDGRLLDLVLELLDGPQRVGSERARAVGVAVLGPCLERHLEPRGLDDRRLNARGPKVEDAVEHHRPDPVGKQLGVDLPDRGAVAEPEVVE